MNWKTFMALLARDGHIARRNMVALLSQTLLQPMLFTFVFGRVMTRSGFMPEAYKNMLLPGIMAISMVLAGIQSVAMPLIAEFQWTKEIEDRLLAPIHIHWFAVEKIVAGMLQALVAGAVVIPAGWLLLRPGVTLDLSNWHVLVVVALLVAMFSATAGLVLGCSVSATGVGLMFSLVVAPMMFFGCAYYPWAALKAFPVLQWAVLVNPLVYASEGLRGTLAPQVPHIPIYAVLAALVVIDTILLAAGLTRFHKKAVQ
jgi:ABC-2 type transport system permease protein